MIAILFVIFFAFLIWYVLWGRKFLSKLPGAQWYYSSPAGEWVEINLFKKSETILYQRVKQMIALLLVVVPMVGGFDLTPYLGFVPEKHRWWVALIPSAALTIDATVGEMLRNRTKKPIELVSAPTTPDTIAAEERVDAANDHAIAVAEEAKKES